MAGSEHSESERLGDRAGDPTPNGSLAGLCMHCGWLKEWGYGECPDCRGEPSTYRELERSFSEDQLDLASLEQLGKVFRTLRARGVDVKLCQWALAYYVKRDLPVQYPIKIPRKMCRRVRELVADQSLPRVEVRQSPMVQPADWDDRAGWDRFHAVRNRWSWSGVEQGQLYDIRNWIDGLKCVNRMKLWLPGCGCDMLPWVYAAAGFEVVATDVSLVAIKIQRAEEQPAWVREQMKDLLKPDVLDRLGQPEAVKLRFAVHDFRRPLAESAFDCIINVQAFQYLPPASMRRAARVFYEALRPGGAAYFCIKSTSPGEADLVEQTLTAAGFYVPYQEADQRYRDALERIGAGAPYDFFGAQFLAKSEAKLSGRKEKNPIAAAVYRRKVRRVKRIYAAYLADIESLKAEVARVQNDGTTKIARLLYGELRQTFAHAVA